MANLGWGLQMTVLGMGIVFGLLALLWGLLRLALRLDNGAASPAASTALANERPAPDSGNSASGDGEMDSDLVAAIAAAVFKHHSVLRHEAAPAMRSYRPGSHLYASRWVATGRTRQTRGWTRHK